MPETSQGKQPNPTDVILPSLGESVTEGTIVRWFKKVGECVNRDEALFEVSTKKVDAEIPSPCAGVLMSIMRMKETRSQRVPSSRGFHFPP